MSDSGLTLTARLTAAVLDARRGIVRMHRDVLAALDLDPWDPVELRGRRTTGAIVAQAGADAPPGILMCDDLILGNLGQPDGTGVVVTKIPLVQARSVEISGTPELMRIISPDMLRRSLLGKLVTSGDDISLLPQDSAPHEGVEKADLDTARRQLSVAMGMQWTTTLLSVTAVDSTGPSLVTGATTVSWRGGDSAPGWSGATPTAAGTTSTSIAATTVSLHTVTAAPAAAPASPAKGETASTAGGMTQQTTTATQQTAVPAAQQTAVPAAPAAEQQMTDAAPAVEDLPGVQVQAHDLHEWLDLGFNHRQVLKELGSKPQLGVLITGPAGVGKTTLVQAVAASVKANLITLSAPAVAAVEAGAAANALRTAIIEAEAKTPAVLLIRDVESLAPSADPPPLTTIFIDLLRVTIAAGKVAVICTSAQPEEVSPDLRRPGLLDHELALPLPDKAGRLALLDTLLRPVPLDSGVKLEDVAARTPGFVAADLVVLRREASVRAALRQRETANPTVNQADLIGALDVVRPTAMSESSLEIARVSLDDVGDMLEVKKSLTEAVLWPLQYPDTFSRLGITPPRGVLLYGPPGCGKTFLVKAIAGSGQTNVLSVKGAELLNKWVGESERAVRELFRRARQASPTLIFMDEIDALAPQRGQGTDGGTTDRVVASLLTELDGVESLRDVVVIGATNRPDLIDPALLRPGRLDRLIYVPPPDAEARAAILKASSKNTPLTRGVDLVALANDLEGYSSADCAAVIREAALAAMRRDMNAPRVTKADFVTAREAVKPSLNQDQVDWLAAYAEERSKS